LSFRARIDGEGFAEFGTVDSNICIAVNNDEATRVNSKVLNRVVNLQVKAQIN
jgi:hypothetical protein